MVVAEVIIELVVIIEVAVIMRVKVVVIIQVVVEVAVIIEVSAMVEVEITMTRVEVAEVDITIIGVEVQEVAEVEEVVVEIVVTMERVEEEVVDIVKRKGIEKMKQKIADRHGLMTRERWRLVVPALLTRAGKTNTTGTRTDNSSRKNTFLIRDNSNKNGNQIQKKI